MIPNNTRQLQIIMIPNNTRQLQIIRILVLINNILKTTAGYDNTTVLPINIISSDEYIVHSNTTSRSHLVLDHKNIS